MKALLVELMSTTKAWIVAPFCAVTSITKGIVQSPSSLNIEATSWVVVERSCPSQTIVGASGSPGFSSGIVSSAMRYCATSTTISSSSVRVSITMSNTTLPSLTWGMLTVILRHCPAFTPGIVCDMLEVLPFRVSDMSTTIAFSAAAALK